MHTYIGLHVEFTLFWFSECPGYHVMSDINFGKGPSAIISETTSASFFFLISSLLWHMMHLLYVYHSLFLNIQSWVFFDTLSTCYFSGKLLVFLQAHWCFTHALSMKQSNNPSSFLPLWSGFPVLPLILSQSFCVLVNLCSYSLSTFFPARTLIIQPFLF